MTAVVDRGGTGAIVRRGWRASLREIEDSIGRARDKESEQTSENRVP